MQPSISKEYTVKLSELHEQDDDNDTDTDNDNDDEYGTASGQTN